MKLVTLFLKYLSRKVGRQRATISQPKLVEIPPGGSAEEIKKIQNRNYQKNWQFKKTHLMSWDEIEA